MKKNEVGRPLRIAYITNVLSSYRVPCFRSLSGMLGGNITFFFLARRMKHRGFILSEESGEFEAEFLPGLSFGNPPFDNIHLNSPWKLLKGGYDAWLISGWAEPTYLLLRLLAPLFRKPLLLFLESTAYETGAGAGGGLKGAYKRWFLRGIDVCVPSGKRASENARLLGFPEDEIVIAPNATDREFFSSRASELLPMRERLREEMSIEAGAFTVLFAGRLVDSLKNVSLLIKACGLLEKQGTGVTLVLAGDGPDRAFYEKLAEEAGVKDARFTGMLGREELCRAYALSDVFVLPSISEPWGFVLNESMEFSLPLVVSDRVGAVGDLVLDGRNGFVFTSGDAEGLARALETLAGEAALRKSMGAESRSIVEEYSPEAWARGMKTAFMRALGSGGQS